MIVLLAPAVPPMMQAVAGTPGYQQLVVFSLNYPALWVALPSLFAAMVIDRVGRRKLLVSSLIAYTLFGMAPLYLTSLHAIIASRVGVDLAETMLMSASITMLGDFFSDLQREKFLAMSTGIASLSATAFFAVGGALTGSNWRTPYAVYGVAVLFLVAVIAVTWEPPSLSVRRELRAALVRSKSFPIFTLLAVYLITITGGITFVLSQIEIGVIAVAHGYNALATAGGVGAIGSVAMPVGAFVFNLMRKRYGVPMPTLVILAFSGGWKRLGFNGSLCTFIFARGRLGSARVRLWFHAHGLNGLDTRTAHL